MRMRSGSTHSRHSLGGTRLHSLAVAILKLRATYATLALTAKIPFPSRVTCHAYSGLPRPLLRFAHTLLIIPSSGDKRQFVHRPLQRSVASPRLSITIAGAVDFGICIARATLARTHVYVNIRVYIEMYSNLCSVTLTHTHTYSHKHSHTHS